MEEYDDSLLASDLADWLATASQADIEAYVRALPENFWQEHAEVRDELLDTLRLRRGRELRERLTTNAVQVLTEPQLTSFIADLAQYNAQSVIAGYQKKYPNLQISDPKPGIAGWGRAAAAAWQNCFYLLSSKRFIEYALYLDSILKTQAVLADLPARSEAATALLAELSQDIAAHNYEAYALAPDFEQRLTDFLAGLTFLPEENIKKLMAPDQARQLFATFTALEYVLGFLLRTSLARSAFPDREQGRRLLWDSLAFDEKLAETDKRERARAMAEPDTDEQADRLAEYFKGLAGLLTLDGIESGSSEQAFSSYMARLTPAQKKSFQRDIRDLVIASPEMRAMLEPLDAEYVAEKLGGLGLKSDRLTFINEQAGKFGPEFWPTAQKALMLLATIL